MIYPFIKLSLVDAIVPKKKSTSESLLPAVGLWRGANLILFTTILYLPELHKLPSIRSVP